MDSVNYLKITKIWLGSLFGFDVLMFLYLFISGRILEIDPIFPDFVTILGGIILFSSVLVAISSIIYAIVKKDGDYVFPALGILLGSFVLLIAMVVLALATVF